MGDSKLVQMRLKEKTLEKLDHLKSLTGETNSTQIVSSSIQLADMVASQMKKGSKIVIEKADGSKETITIVGLN